MDILWIQCFTTCSKRLWVQSMVSVIQLFLVRCAKHFISIFHQWCIFCNSGKVVFCEYGLGFWQHVFFLITWNAIAQFFVLIRMILHVNLIVLIGFQKPSPRGTLVLQEAILVNTWKFQIRAMKTKVAWLRSKDCEFADDTFVGHFISGNLSWMNIDVNKKFTIAIKARTKHPWVSTIVVRTILFINSFQGTVSGKTGGCPARVALASLTNCFFYPMEGNHTILVVSLWFSMSNPVFLVLSHGFKNLLIFCTVGPQDAMSVKHGSSRIDSGGFRGHPWVPRFASLLRIRCMDNVLQDMLHAWRWKSTRTTNGIKRSQGASLSVKDRSYVEDKLRWEWFLRNVPCRRVDIRWIQGFASKLWFPWFLLVHWFPWLPGPMFLLGPRIP